MRYRLDEVEITRPLPALEFASHETGAGLLVRRGGRPIGFLMRENNGKQAWPPGELDAWISGELKTKIVEEAIREELVLSPASVPFPSLSVAICTKDRTATLSRCLESVIALQRRYRFELLVIDNAPSDQRTAKLVERFSEARYVLEKYPGLNFARNRAWREASGDIIAYLDDDVVVDSGWLAGLHEAWAENPDAAAFTGLVMPLSLDTRAQVLFEKRDGFRRGFDKNRFGQELPGNPLYPCGAGIFGAGCNMAFRRQTLQELGGFDEALDTGPSLPGGGDLDIFYRIIRAGYVLVYEPSFMVFHEHRESDSALHRQYYTWGLGFMAFVEKSYRNDIAQRSRFRRLVIWWVSDQILQLKQALRGEHVLPFSMVLAEFCGGVVGIFGEYSRSLKRVAAVRNAGV
ncbi:MAG TPA: glycosyltransferase [Chthoniobacterales bacterium]|nr:glycosyltransferase [Chthoniobacterales bacterium]